MNDMVPTAPGSDYPLAGPVDDSPSPASHLRWRRYLVFLAKFWWVPVLTLILGLAAGAAYVHWKTPTFISRASMWETVKVHLPEGSLFTEDVQNFLGTQTKLLQSSTLRDQALARLKLMTNHSIIPKGKDGQPVPVDIRVSGNAKSSVFEIQASGSNPRFTQLYLDALMAAYLDYKRNIRQVISGDTLASISGQVQRWERDLKTQQDALTAFQRTNNLAVLQEEGSIAGGYLAKLKTQLSDLQLQARLLSAMQSNRLASAVGNTNSTAMWTDATAGLNDRPNNGATDRQAAFRELELLKIQRARLSKNLRPQHPKIVKLDAEITREEKLLDIFRRQSREELAAAQQANQLKIANVTASIEEWKTKVAEANRRIAEADQLKRNVERVKNVYDRLVALVQNVGISRNIDQENLAILEPASPAKRSYTSEKSGLALAVVGGLGLGLGIVFLIEVRDDRFTSVIEVNSRLGDAVVGMLPEVSRNETGSLSLLAADDTRHLYAESYRNLRSALLFLTAEGQPPKVLLVSSAMPHEGKSTVAANLARTLALSGSRVLLVDGDLRKGQLDRLLHLHSEPGLAELLHQTCTPEEVIQTDSIPGFAFVSHGKCSGHPGDLLLGSGLDQILARWRQEYDYVVIDSTPLFAADDASSLAPKADGTLLVVRRQHSSARAVNEALESLARRQARILGVVFNGADASARSYYYYKYSDYYPAAPPA